MSIEAVKDVIMDHLMSGKFTSGTSAISCYMLYYRHFIFLEIVFYKCEAVVLIISAVSSVHLVAVMVCHEFIIRVAKVTIMSWYVSKIYCVNIAYVSKVCSFQ